MKRSTSVRLLEVVIPVVGYTEMPSPLPPVISNPSRLTPSELTVTTLVPPRITGVVEGPATISTGFRTSMFELTPGGTAGAYPRSGPRSTTPRCGCVAPRMFLGKENDPGERGVGGVFFFFDCLGGKMLVGGARRI